MAEETAPELAETNNTTAQDMEVENLESGHDAGEKGDSEPNVVDSATNGESKQKRNREDTESEEDKDGVSKKPKVEEEKSVEEDRLEKLEQGAEEEKKSGPVTLGPKTFGSSVEMFDYFFKLLHNWAPNLNINKYEHMMLLELLKIGHTEPDKKIGGGIRAFQVRYHPMWKSRCFFLIREDESVDDFSFRKCVDHVIPLPASMKVKSDVSRALGGGGGGRGRGGKGDGGRGGRRGHGKGGKGRH